MTITTNNIPRQLVCFHDLPEKVQPEFDYIEGEDRLNLRCFEYKGEWYDSHEFIACESGSEFRQLGWHGVQSDTHFSGILVKYMPRDERVVVGRYYT